MAGVTKHIFEHDVRDILEMWNSQLKCVQRVLPRNYTDIDIINTLKRFYPHEWTAVEMKYWYKFLVQKSNHHKMIAFIYYIT